MRTLAVLGSYGPPSHHGVPHVQAHDARWLAGWLAGLIVLLPGASLASSRATPGPSPDDVFERAHRVGVFTVEETEAVASSELSSMPHTIYTLKPVEWIGEEGDDEVQVIMPGAVFPDGSIYHVIDVPILAPGEELLLAIERPNANQAHHLIASTRAGLARKDRLPKWAREDAARPSRSAGAEGGEDQLLYSSGPTMPPAKTSHPEGSLETGQADTADTALDQHTDTERWDDLLHSVRAARGGAR